MDDQIRRQTETNRNRLNEEIHEYDQQKNTSQYFQSRYRWIIIILTGFMFIMNGLGKFALMPITKQVSIAYGVDIHAGFIPVVLAFIVFSLVNFPANYVIDTKGTRISFMIGSGLFTLGLAFYVLIDFWFYFTIFGSILVSAGQPFLVNCPAKIATYWFIPENRPFATSLMTGQLLIGIGLGYLIPGVMLGNQTQKQIIKERVFLLYSLYLVFSLICFLLISLLMKKQPKVLPSFGAAKDKLSIKQSLVILKTDINLIKLTIAYSLLLCSFLSFQAILNPLLLLYGFSEIQIVVLAEIFIICGVPGAMLWSIFIKRTLRYVFTSRFISTGTFASFCIMCLTLHFLSTPWLVIIVGGIFGAVFEAIVPITYDLCCQMGFPIGQGFLIGILNGSSMVFTFIVSTLIIIIFDFEQKSEGIQSMCLMMAIMFAGCILFWNFKPNLKRRNAQLQKQKSKQIKNEQDINDKAEIKEIEMEQLQSRQRKQSNYDYKLSVNIDAFQKYISDHKKKMEQNQEHQNFQGDEI